MSEINGTENQSVTTAAIFFLFKIESSNFFKHYCETRAGETLVWDWYQTCAVTVATLGIFPSYSLSFVKICI